MDLHRPSQQWQLGFALSLVTVASWGTLPIFLKMTLQYLDVVTLTWFRFLLAGMILAAFLACKRRFPPFHKARRPALGLLVIATLGLVGNYLFYQLGLQRVSPSTAQLLIQTSPLMFMLGSVLIFKEQLTRRQIFGLFLLTGGFVMFFNDHLVDFISGMSEYKLGIIYITIAAVSWAVYALAQKQLLMSYTSPGIMVFIYIVSAFVVAPVSSPAKILQLDSTGLMLLIYCALNTVVGYGAFSEALAHWEASKVSATLALSPIITLATSAWLAHTLWAASIPPDDFNALSYIGAVVTVVGAMTVALGRTKNRA